MVVGVSAAGERTAPGGAGVLGVGSFQSGGSSWIYVEDDKEIAAILDWYAR